MKRIWLLIVGIALIVDLIVIQSSLNTSRHIDTTPDHKMCLVYPKGEMGFAYGTYYAISPDEECKEIFEGLEDIFEVGP